MSISRGEELEKIKTISQIVGETLRKMREYAAPGMTTKEIDEYGGQILSQYGASSAPMKAYNFPGWTCICVNHEVAHGVPKAEVVLKEGDLINIDVSAELDGFWSDNGGSFVLGEDIHGHQRLVDTSRKILRKAISRIQGGVRIADIGYLIETEAKRASFRVIRNLAGHGVGKSLHEEPSNILNYRDKKNRQRFHIHSVVAIETFISTHSDMAVEVEGNPDGWTLIGDRGGFVAQHEHTILVTDGMPEILTESNGIFD